MEKHELSMMIHDFTEHLEVEGGRSSRTAENYEHYLNRLVDFAGTIYVEDITQELIRKYRLWLNRHINIAGFSTVSWC